MSRGRVQAKGDPPLCECGCGQHVKSSKNGIWSRWRPGHSGRRADWRERTPEKPRTRERRRRDEQLSLFPELAPPIKL
jgi:hypothetical protein